MHLLLAAINQATRRNEIKSNLQLGSNSNRYAPRLPQQETKSSTKQLAPTDQFSVWKSFLKPASLKIASLVVLPVAISHKASLKPKRCASATLIQKTSAPQERAIGADFAAQGLPCREQLFFRPTPSWLPPGRSTCLRACCNLD